MFKIIKRLKLSPLWIALYWLNPLVIKELINSAHMEALLIPFLIGSLYYAMIKKVATSTVFLLIAVGVKLWPAILLPLFLRPLLPTKMVWRWTKDWQKVFLYGAVFSLAFFILILPIINSGFDKSSGFVAYVQGWQSNSAFSPVFNSLWQTLLTPTGLTEKTITLLTKIMIALSVSLIALFLAVPNIKQPQDIVKRSFIIATTMFLLSPAQFPWYGLWVLPFTVFFPVTGIVILSALLPLYYYGFHLMTTSDDNLFTSHVVWLIWLPVWGALLWSFRSNVQSYSTRMKAKLFS